MFFYLANWFLGFLDLCRIFSSFVQEWQRTPLKGGVFILQPIHDHAQHSVNLIMESPDKISVKLNDFDQNILFSDHLF